jgi:hypothetical protein
MSRKYKNLFVADFGCADSAGRQISVPTNSMSGEGTEREILLDRRLFGSWKQTARCNTAVGGAIEIPLRVKN